MSKALRPFYPLFFASFLCLQIFTNAFGQKVEAEINVHPATSIVDVRGRFVERENLKNPRNFSFIREAAGIDGLAGRIRSLELFAPDGKPVTFRKLIDGEFLAEVDIVSWRYQVDLTPHKNRNAAAHTSWIFEEKGLLMPSDIFPQSARSGKITVSLPSDWRIFSWDRGPAERSFNVADFGQAVFAIGKGWNEKIIAVPTWDSQIFVVMAGKWNFTLDDAALMAATIYNAHRRSLGPIHVGHAHVILTNFPSAVAAGNWEAETRGNTVTIVSSDMPFRTQSIQRLHEQLRHELFHLWIPNNANLTGNYAWFYEGFAIYQSLKAAIGMNQIRFEDFLDTLSRAHMIDATQSRRQPLLQASAARYAGANTQVYARGMLVAFLTDLALLNVSKGKRSVEDLLREFFTKHRTGAAVDGNGAAIEALSANREVAMIVEKYVRGSEPIDWSAQLAMAGIEDIDPGSLTNLRVKEKPGGRQKALLDKLGYNNWRKLSRNSR